MDGIAQHEEEKIPLHQGCYGIKMDKVRSALQWDKSTSNKTR